MASWHTWPGSVVGPVGGLFLRRLYFLFDRHGHHPWSEISASPLVICIVMVALLTLKVVLHAPATVFASVFAWPVVFKLTRVEPNPHVPRTFATSFSSLFSHFAKR